MAIVVVEGVAMTFAIDRLDAAAGVVVVITTLPPVFAAMTDAVTRSPRFQWPSTMKTATWFWNTTLSTTQRQRESRAEAEGERVAANRPSV